MNRFQSVIARRFLSTALSRPAPDLVPRSSPRAATVDCFLIHIREDDDIADRLVRALRGNELDCLEWNGEKYDIPVRVSLAEMRACEFKIIHFYGYHDLNFSGLWAFVRARTLRLPYVACAVQNIWHRASQAIFNKKKLVAKRRIDLLNTVLRLQESGLRSVLTTSLMGELYTNKWLFHPARESQAKRVALHVAALVESQELRHAGEAGVVITGAGLQAIERYEEEERRHRASQILQRIGLGIAALVMLLTAAQAELVKLPVLFDWSGKPRVEQPPTPPVQPTTRQPKCAD